MPLDASVSEVTGHRLNDWGLVPGRNVDLPLNHHMELRSPTLFPSQWLAEGRKVRGR